ncbi:hypothetical protein [Propionispora hippei]|uniref:Uncharacterized protein n=1 Tax=Propionispora hippei DSM 15287 TaxID=1123003 RepID=A0A1M6FYV3_9FIRM|nr:hypothetical protein [Propionispora hippei]SHJ02861.1 hypothetical protein SAMN02745170_01555 [Propionispora hippei DSM 15287]
MNIAKIIRNIIYVFLVLNILNSFFFLAPRSNKAYKDLQQEYHELNILPGSTLIHQEDVHKPEAVYLLYDFAVNKSWDEISDFYLKEMEKNGWKWDGKVEKFGKDDNGRTLRFYKGNYKLSIGCSNIQTNDSSYNIFLRWAR